MNNKWITRFTFTIAFVAVLALGTGKALAQVLEGTNLNPLVVISPYWQNNTENYTFIAITHPSLSGMASQIGVKITAFENNATTYDTATSVTVSVGQTSKIFIARSGSSITSLTGVTFIRETATGNGNLRFEPVATTPRVATSVGTGDGIRDVTLLSYWGVVFLTTNSTGFALEFIGDVQDESGSSGQRGINID